MKNCDTVFIVGSTMPWFEYYPKPGHARGVHIDMKSDRIGMRYPVEIGLVGDVKATLAALIPLLQRQTDRGFLQEAQSRMADWYRLLAEVESTSRAPLRPQMVIKAVSDLIADDVVISLDCGANTHFAARNLMLRPSQRLTGTGMMASMAPGLVLRHRGPAGLSGPPVRADRRGRRIRHADGGDGDRGSAQPSGEDHRSEEQQPGRSEVQ